MLVLVPTDPTTPAPESDGSTSYSESSSMELDLRGDLGGCPATGEPSEPREPRRRRDPAPPPRMACFTAYSAVGCGRARCSSAAAGCLGEGGAPTAMAEAGAEAASPTVVKRRITLAARLSSATTIEGGDSDAFEVSVSLPAVVPWMESNAIWIESACDRGPVHPSDPSCPSRRPALGSGEDPPAATVPGLDYPDATGDVTGEARAADPNPEPPLARPAPTAPPRSRIGAPARATADSAMASDEGPPSRVP